MNWEWPLPDPLPDPLGRFPVIVALPVLWGDMDAFGHVNNTIPVRWFESGRVALLERMGVAAILRRETLGPILAAVNCHYRRQIHFPDTVLIGSRVSAWGRSSLTVVHSVYSLRQELVTTEGESVVVVFDYQHQRPVRIPEPFKEAVLRLQPSEPPAERHRSDSD